MAKTLGSNACNSYRAAKYCPCGLDEHTSVKNSGSCTSHRPVFGWQHRGNRLRKHGFLWEGQIKSRGSIWPQEAQSQGKEAWQMQERGVNAQVPLGREQAGLCQAHERYQQQMFAMWTAWDRNRALVRNPGQEGDASLWLGKTLSRSRLGLAEWLLKASWLLSSLPRRRITFYIYIHIHTHIIIYVYI